MMKNSVCKLEFHKYSISDMDTFSNEVGNGIFNNPTVFTIPPITNVAYSVIQEAFGTTAADYSKYGITKKTAFIVAKSNLIEALDTFAEYVDSIALGDVSTIALAGFTPTKESNQPNEPLEKIDSFTVSLSKSSGEVVIEIPAYTNQYAVNYNCICVEGIPLNNPTLSNGQIVLHADDPTVRQDFNKKRRKVFAGLTPGTKYYFYVFASNTAGVSPLSNPQSIWAS